RIVRGKDQAYVSEVGRCRAIALHTDYSIYDEEIGNTEPEHINDHFMEAAGAASCLVQLGLLGAGQKTITVFNCPGQDSQSVGFEFRHADDNIGIQNSLGDAYKGHELGIKNEFP